MSWATNVVMFIKCARATIRLNNFGENCCSLYCFVGGFKLKVLTTLINGREFDHRPEYGVDLMGLQNAEN